MRPGIKIQSLSSSVRTTVNYKCRCGLLFNRFAATAVATELQRSETLPCRFIEAGFVEWQSLAVFTKAQKRHGKIEPQLGRVGH